MGLDPALEAQAFILAAGVLAALVAVPVSFAAAGRLGIVDRPDGDLKPHRGMVPRTGSWVIAAAVAAGVALAGPVLRQSLAPMFPYLAGAGVAFLVGLLDDWRPLDARVKFILLLTAGLVVLGLGGGSALAARPGPDILLTLFCLVGGANAMNLIDGMDGLAGGVIALAAVSLSVLSVRFGEPAAGLVLAALLGGTTVFLVYNRPPARVFLGDSGSLAFGFLLAGVALHFGRGPNGPVRFFAALLPLAIPILDTAMSIARRLVRRQSAFAGDRDHSYDILARRFRCRRRALLAFLLLSALLAGAGVFYPDLAGAVPPLALVAAGVACPGLVAWAGISSRVRARGTSPVRRASQ